MNLGKILKAHFDEIIALRLEVWENFAELGSVKQLPRETILKGSQTIEKNFNFLIEGSGGNLVWKKNNFVCTDISTQHQTICDFVSLMTQKPSLIEVRLFENSLILQIPYKNFQQTFLKGNYGEQVTRMRLESAYDDKQQQQIDLLTKTAKERYLEMIKQNNEIKHIPLKYVASFLGITPQSLSRIRSEKI